MAAQDWGSEVRETGRNHRSEIPCPVNPNLHKGFRPPAPSVPGRSLLEKAPTSLLRLALRIGNARTGDVPKGQKARPARELGQWAKVLLSSQFKLQLARLPACVLVLHGFVGNLQAAINDREAFPKLLFLNTQRRIGEESVPAHECVQAFLAEEFSQSRHFLRGAVKWG